MEMHNIGAVLCPMLRKAESEGGQPWPILEKIEKSGNARTLMRQRSSVSRRSYLSEPDRLQWRKRSPQARHHGPSRRPGANVVRCLP